MTLAANKKCSKQIVNTIIVLSYQKEKINNLSRINIYDCFKKIYDHVRFILDRVAFILGG